MDEEYSKRIKRCFATAFKALEKHHGADNFSEIYSEFAELSKGDTLLSDLLVVVYNELAQEYRKRNECINPETLKNSE